jgi:hypothetical protein
MFIAGYNVSNVKRGANGRVSSMSISGNNGSASQKASVEAYVRSMLDASAGKDSFGGSKAI